jgi:hypothetical protein
MRVQNILIINPTTIANLGSLQARMEALVRTGQAEKPIARQASG